MTPQAQLIEHDPAAGRWGDCFRTCVACLLDLPAGDVPNVFDKGANAGEGAAAMRDWLRPQGLTLISFAFATGISIDDIQASLAALNPGTHYLFSGKSRIGSNHVVVCRDGEIVHDTSGNGIVGPCDDGFYWADFIGKLL